MKHFAICYDISDDRTRRRVVKVLRRVGTRVQESVFDVAVRSDRAMDELWGSLVKVVGQHGCLRAYPIRLEDMPRSRSWGQDGPRPLAAALIV